MLYRLGKVSVNFIKQKQGPMHVVLALGHVMWRYCIHHVTISYMQVMSKVYVLCGVPIS